MPITDLTKYFVDHAGVPINRRKIEYFDRDIKGWYLEVRGETAKTFYYRYRDDFGRQRSLRIAKYDRMDYESVRRRAIEIREAVMTKNFDSIIVKSARRITLSEFIDEFYVPYIKLKKRSWETDLSFIKNHILPRFGELKMHQISKMDLVSFHLQKKQSGLAPATADRLIILIRYMFNLAIKWEIDGVLKNPANKFDLFNQDNRRERFLTEAEVGSLIKEIEMSGNKLLKPIIMTLLLTGMRKSEVLNAKWLDIDFENKVWFIPITKAGKPRYVPLGDMLIEVLGSLPRKYELIFANPKTGKRFMNIFYSWDRARARAGLEGVRIHDLRHSYASFLINGGRSIYEVQKLLGHSNIAMTQRYAHLEQKTLIEASSVAATVLKNSMDLNKVCLIDKNI